MLGESVIPIYSLIFEIHVKDPQQNSIIIRYHITSMLKMPKMLLWVYFNLEFINLWHLKPFWILTHWNTRINRLITYFPIT